VKVNLSHEGEVESHDHASHLVLQLSPGAWFDVLLVADAPVDILEPDHRLEPTLLSGPGWLRDPGTLLPAWTLQCSARPMSCLGLAVEVV